MNTKPIIMVSGEPKGVFNEIFFKIKKKINFMKPIILISSKNILIREMNRFNYKYKLNILNLNTLSQKKINQLNNKKINLIDVELLKNSGKSPDTTRQYIQKCFDIGLSIISTYKCSGFINGPINKKTFLNHKYPGVTEYLAKKFKIDNFAMLIYTKNLAVCPITTHLPLKDVHKSISKAKIISKIKLINQFYKMKFKKNPKVALAGLNPHCESPFKSSEEKKYILPAIKSLKKSKIFVKGPLSPDTLFIDSEKKNFDVIVGMYHDQVLTPIKALYGFDAINITLGLPFIRISPDHGPNKKMYGKNLSNPNSLFQAIKFLNN